MTKTPGVSSILLFSDSGINFPRPLYFSPLNTFLRKGKGPDLHQDPCLWVVTNGSGCGSGRPQKHTDPTDPEHCRVPDLDPDLQLLHVEQRAHNELKMVNLETKKCIKTWFSEHILRSIYILCFTNVVGSRISYVYFSTRIRIRSNMDMMILSSLRLKYANYRNYTVY